jgi:two-component system nitrogen regulation response regulator GlnG
VPKLFIIDDRDQTVELCHRHLGEFEYVTRCGRSVPCSVCEEQERACPFKCAHDYIEAERALKELDRLPDLVVLDLHFALPKERLLPQDKTDMPEDTKGQRVYLEGLRRRQGLLILERLRAQYPRLAVVMLTTTDFELGEHRPKDPLLYLCQNEIVDSRSLVAEIRRALLLSHETEEGAVFWGKNETMAQVRRSLGILARSPLPTLIEGETGTGKSYLAEHVIHPRSGVKGNLVVTDLSTIPVSLLPAHLFGAKKGAYTGATADHRGVFEQAHQGTLFLDEIANLDLDLQRQLLLVLERSEVTRLGDQTPRATSTKLIAATNQNLEMLVEQGRFRRDLYMRLNPATKIHIPPLRERTEDIPDLVRHSLLEALASPAMASLVHAFLVKHPTLSSFDPSENVVWFRRPTAKLAKANAFSLFVAPSTLKRLVDHHWPGNHRELRLFATNLLVFTLCQMLEGSENRERERAPAVLPITDELVDRLLPRTNLVTKGIDSITARTEFVQNESPFEKGQRLLVDIPKGLGFAQTANAVEKQYLEQLFVKYGGDLSTMAFQLLGPKGSARQVHLRLNQLGLRIKALREMLVSRRHPQRAQGDD